MPNIILFVIGSFFLFSLNCTMGPSPMPKIDRYFYQIIINSDVYLNSLIPTSASPSTGFYTTFYGDNITKSGVSKLLEITSYPPSSAIESYNGKIYTRVSETNKENTDRYNKFFKTFGDTITWINTCQVAGGC